MELIKGSAVAASISKSISETIEKTGMIPPHLAIIRVGEKADDISYEKSAIKRMDKVGIHHTVYTMEDTVSQEEFLKVFDQINQDPKVDGILLLRPLPSQLDEHLIERRIDPEKDVDGIGPVNMAHVYAGTQMGYAPCTAEAVMKILHHSGICITGKRAVVIGRSLVIGKPLAMLLIKENATVTVCHTKTKQLEETCRNAEILIAAAGQAEMVNEKFVGKDAVVIDVGIHVKEDKTMCGDVDLESISSVAALATPVPGGVGAVTTSVLAEHVLFAAMKKQGIKSPDLGV